MARIGQNTAEPQEDIRGIVNKKTQQSKRKRRVINTILILLFLLLLIGIGFLIYFIIFKLTYVPPPDVAVDMNFTSYSVVAGQETQIGDKQTLSFDNKEESTSKDLTFEYAIAEQSDDEYIRLEYDIDNKTGAEYEYVIDFSGLLEGVDQWIVKYDIREVDPEAAEPAKPTITDDINELSSSTHNTVTDSSNRDLKIFVLIQINPSALGADALLSGNIVFTISTVEA